MIEIFILGDKNFSLKDIEKINHVGAKRNYYSDDFLEYIVEFEDVVYTDLPIFPKGIRTAKPFDCIVYSFSTYDDEMTRIDFPKETLSKIPFKVEGFITMSFRCAKTMKAVLRQEDFPQKVYIDDNFGSIMSLQEFNKLDWQWDGGNLL